MNEKDGEWIRDIDGITGSLPRSRSMAVRRPCRSRTCAATSSPRRPRAQAPKRSRARRHDRVRGPPRHQSAQERLPRSVRLRTEQASGTIAMGARTYQPQLGRFLQAEPGGRQRVRVYVRGPCADGDPAGEAPPRPRSRPAPVATPRSEAGAGPAPSARRRSSQNDGSTEGSPAALALPESPA